jgi:nucleotide-binding universal stress UspA family protein
MHSSMSHVLVPTDFGAPSREAFRVALEMAHGSYARVTLLHVMPERVPGDLDAIGFLHLVLLNQRGIPPSGPAFPSLAASQSALDRLRDELHPEWRESVEIVTAVRSGDIATEIARYVREEAVDALVLGVHRRGWRSAFRSRRSRKILHCAPCRVVFVHPQRVAQGGPGASTT